MANNELIETLNAIKLDKDTNLKPENLKKGVSLLGIDGTLESNSSVKLFETVEDMNNDENPQIDDLAIVYREDIQNMTVGTQTQYITFPETVVLSEAFIGDVYCMLRAVDETVMFDGQVMLSQSMFDFNGYTNTGMIRVRYISSDGITYNRDEFMGDSGDLTNPVDLGTSVGVYMSEEWNDNLGYFMQIGGMTFDGLYEYASKTDTNKAAWLTNLHEVGGKGVYDLERENGLDISNVSSICTEIISHFGLSTSQGHYIAFIQSDNVLSAYVGLTIEHNNIVGTQLGLVQDTENNWGIGTYSKELTDGAYKITLGDTLTYTKLPAGTKIPVKDYDWGHWKYGSCAPTDKFTVLSVRNGVVSVASAYHIYGYNVNYEYALNTYGVTSAYYFALNQYNLMSSNQLLPDISAYGKNGNVTGDGSIYDNTLTPTEYNESNSTLDEILEGYKPVSVTQMNLFLQTTEPENKNGIWVKTDTQYENKIAVQNALSETGEYTKLKNIPYDFSNGSAVAVGTDIYLLGRNTNYKYDTLTDTYTLLTNIPINLQYGSAVAIGTDIYILGGVNSGLYIYKYDTLTDKYSKLTNIPSNFSYGSAVAIGTDIYLLGGNISGNKNYKYDTLTGTYIQLANIPYSFSYGSAVAIGTDIYLLGDYYSTTNNYKYNTLTDTYTRLANIPDSFTRGSAVAVGTDIYLLGGNGGSKNNNYKYNTLTDTYTQLVDIPFSFSSGCAVLLGLNIYLLCETYNYKFTLTLQNDIPNNSLVLEQTGSIYKTILFDSDFTNGLEYKFTNVWLKNADGTIDITTPVYYGDGAKWVQFNGEVDN